jgi:hypothetical protein
VTCEVDAKDDVLALAIDVLRDRVVLIVKKSEVPSEARVGDSDTSAGDDDDWAAWLSWTDVGSASGGSGLGLGV